MAAKEYIHYIDDLGLYFDKREFDNGANIWDAAIRSIEALKPPHNTGSREIADKMEWMLLGEETTLPLQVQLCIKNWCRQLRASA